jgi:hypothetical protein
VLKGGAGRVSAHVRFPSIYLVLCRQDLGNWTKHLPFNISQIRAKLVLFRTFQRTMHSARDVIHPDDKLEVIVKPGGGGDVAITQSYDMPRCGKDSQSPKDLGKVLNRERCGLCSVSSERYSRDIYIYIYIDTLFSFLSSNRGTCKRDV